MRNQRISNAFKERFCDIKDVESYFGIFSNPFFVNSEKVPQKYQMELIELQCNSVLEVKF